MTAVTLYIGLVYNVKAQLITKGHKAWIVGVMAGSDRIYIMTLHNKKVFSHMIERNSGTISVESTVGEGTVFSVSFPVFDTEEET